MKESVEIRHYGGMVGTLEERDHPAGTATYAKNLDLVTQRGAFSPLPEDGEAAAGNIVANTFGKFSVDGDEVAAFRNPSDSKVYYATGLNNNPPSATDTGFTRSEDESTAIASDGLAAHLGFGPNGGASYKPVWVGEIAHDQFGIDSSTSSYFATQGTVAADLMLDSTAAYIRVDDPYGGSNNALRVTIPYDKEGATPRRYDNNEVIFDVGHRYAYYAAFVYDGFQESPLRYLGSFSVNQNSVVVQDTSGAIGTPDTLIYARGTTIAWDDSVYQKQMDAEMNASEASEAATGLKAIRFRLWVRHTDNSGPGGYEEINRRVTGIRIYRADDFGGGEGQARLVQTINIDDSAWTRGGSDDRGEQVLSGDVDNVPDGWYWQYLFEDTYYTGDSFEERNGYSQSLAHMDLRWGVSTNAEGYHVVGNCWHRDLKGIESWLFRSQPHRFDTFDWSKDYLVLPTKPVAMATFLGRVYAFSDSRTYVVNVGTFDVEDTWEGIGCSGQRSVVITDKGMFWCDANNIYHHDGSRLNVIGQAVLRNTFEADAAWLLRDVAVTPVCCYHPVYASLIICYKGNSGAYVGLMYHVDSGKWTSITFSPATGTLSNFSGVLYRKDGTPLLCADTTSPGANLLFDLFSDAVTNRAWQWVGYQMESPGQRNVYYHAEVAHRNSAPTDVYFYEDDPLYASPQTDGSPVAGTKTKRWKINSDSVAPWKKVRSFSLRLDGTGAQDATQVSLIRRRLNAR